MKNVKTLIMLVLCICCGMVSAAYAAGGYSDDNIVFYDTLFEDKNYTIDEIPKVTVRYNLSDGGGLYLLRLVGNETDIDVIRMSSTDGVIKKYSYEFPVKKEGPQALRIELLKNGEVIYTNTYSVDYIQSVKQNGYGKRGFATHFGHNTYYAQDADLLEAIGAEVFRDGMYWSAVETVKGVYDFTNYNHYFKSIFDKNIDMLCVLHGTNKLYLNENADLTEANKIENEAERAAAILAAKQKIVTDEQIEGFANFVLAAAKKYPQLKEFELYNEPGFNYTGAEYSKIALAAAKTLKEYNPALKVYVGCVVNSDRALENGVEFTENFLAEELYPYIDSVSYHVYTVGYYADNSEFNTLNHDYFSIVRQRGGWKELSITETGWYIVKPVWGEWGPDQTKQASELVKRAVMTDDLDYALLTFYDFKNDGADEANEEHNWGVITKDQKMRKSYYSVKEYLKNVGKAQYLGRVYLTDGIKAYAYKANEDYFLIAWAEPINEDTYIRNNNNNKAEYTFSLPVVIRDMYGEDTGTGNLLKTDFDPKYIHGLTDDFVLEKISLYGTDELIALPDEYQSQEVQIKANYQQICREKSIAAVDEYINYCYSFGDELIRLHKINRLNMSLTELSALLCEISAAAQKGGKLAACCPDCPDSIDIDSLLREYQAMGDIIEFSDLSGLTYLSEPYSKGKELLEAVAKYDEEDRVTPIQGKNYTVSSTGLLSVKGTTPAKLAAIKLVKDNEILYLDTVNPENMNYEISYQLPGYGEYTLYVKTIEQCEERISYCKGDYLSVEDAMTYHDTENAKRLLNWTRELADEYFVDKNSGLPLYVEKIQHDDRTYLCITYKHDIGIVLAAAYSEGKMYRVAMEKEGICMLDVTGLDKYTLKVFNWNSAEDMLPEKIADEYGISSNRIISGEYSHY